MKPSQTYQTLHQELVRIAHLESILGLLHWDEQVNLPENSAGFRGSQNAHFAELLHRESTRPEIEGWLAALEAQQDTLTSDEQAVLREARRAYDLAVKLPADFVKRRSAAHSRAYHVWRKAREANDFSAYAPALEENLSLAREEASYHGKSGAEAYDFHIDQHDPGLTASFIATQFTKLRDALIPMVAQILESPVKADGSILRGFPEEGQEKFLREVIERIGFDFTRGRLDRAVHPFCAGVAADTRITTRYDRDNPLDSLSSSIHETGHALYAQGLPEEHMGTALGLDVGMAVHESQSRLWENQVGRSRAFWNYWESRYRATFPEQLQNVTSDELFLVLNNVAITPIRVDADEVTYNLHIILRFELEKQLFDGSLEVRDLPAAWNERSTAILGHTPKNDREGVLQDVHWSGGAFGYFPSYCLGNMLAAQLWYTVLDAIPDLEAQFAQGEFQPLLAWLRQQIHHEGKRYSTRELTQKVTGSDLAPDALLRYLHERYLPLYPPA